MSGIKQTMCIMRDLVGKDGKQIFEKKEFLNRIRGINKEVAKQIEQSVKGITNPTFEVSGKASANYNIASIKIKNGEELIGSGSVSVSFGDPTKTPKIKSRLSLPDGTLSSGKSIEDGEFYIIRRISDKSSTPLIDKYSMNNGRLVATNHPDIDIVSKELTCQETCLDYFNKEFGGLVKRIEFNKAKNEYEIFERCKDGRIRKLRMNDNGVRISLKDEFNSKEDILYIPTKISKDNRPVMYIGEQAGTADLEILFAKDGVTIEQIAGAEAREYQYLIGHKWDRQRLENFFGHPLNITPEEMAEYANAQKELASPKNIDKNLLVDYLGMVLPKYHRGEKLSELDEAVVGAVREFDYGTNQTYQKAMDRINSIMEKRKQ